jgi:2,4-dienoyl-CoA reductase-like NADH-dependent reductase (Old Yellow Enzyme family)
MSQEKVDNRTIWRKRASYSACLMIVAGLVSAGCGGGNDGGTESQGLAKEQFIAKAKAICAEAKRNTAQFSNDFPGPHATPSQAQQFFKEVAPYSKQAADKLAALPAPVGDKQVKALQDAYEKAARRIAAAGESPTKAKAALKNKAGELGSCAVAPPS